MKEKADQSNKVDDNADVPVCNNKKQKAVQVEFIDCLIVHETPHDSEKPGSAQSCPIFDFKFGEQSFVKSELRKLESSHAVHNQAQNLLLFGIPM